MEITGDGRRVFVPVLTEEELRERERPWSPSERQLAGYDREIAACRAKYGSERAEALARFLLAGRVTLTFYE